jgi:uncharacterized protein with HEPN domain
MPRRDVRMYLFDLLDASRCIAEFTSGRTWNDYSTSAFLRSAVERQFEIIGEALSQARRASPEIVSRISDVQQIIDFRNRLIHGYDQVAHDIVWDTIVKSLPRLRSEAEALLHELDAQA